MIGVVAHPTEREVVEEFFELFKTPWEFHQKDRPYDVLICTQDPLPETPAKLLLRYGGRLTAFDAERQIAVKARRGGTVISHQGRPIPLYGDATTFPTSRCPVLIDTETKEAVIFSDDSKPGLVLRIGYDLFQEIGLLLMTGQPAAHSESATLELHIRLLRDLILDSGVPVVEIPPVPERYPFMVCLTHDIDHPLLRNHWADRTMFGFLYRATLGTLVNVCRGRKSVGDLFVNWAAALKLPLVYLGIAKDFWSDFDRYVDLEAGLGATYFVIPKRDDAGQPLNGQRPAERASRYEIADVTPQLKQIISAGGEIGVHGIDAWVDSGEALEEWKRVTQVPGLKANGVRMHWLFLDEKSPKVLEKAGFSFDSSVGYNETIGYRAGTAQAFKPLNAENLLELSLHVMDTALFFPDFLNLSEAVAKQRVWKLIDETEEFGGALTINWHDRSIAPERLWENFYLRLLAELKRRNAWFPTATQAISWFRKRRSATLESVSGEGGAVRVVASVPPDSAVPGLRVRLYKPAVRNNVEPSTSTATRPFVDLTLRDKIDVELTL